jgi:DNA anti-recombination protein RmuC
LPKTIDKDKSLKELKKELEDAGLQPFKMTLNGLTTTRGISLKEQVDNRTRCSKTIPELQQELTQSGYTFNRHS